MSRSFKKPIVRERSLKTSEYWRIIRRHQRNNMRSDRFTENEQIDDPRNIINDYFKRDYRFTQYGKKRDKDRIEWETKYKRK